MVEKDASGPLAFYNGLHLGFQRKPVEGFAMRHVVIAVSLLFLVAGGTGWWLFGNPSLQDKAFRAYQAGRYAEALPLLKQWAATPKIRNDRESLKVALAYISDTEQKIKDQNAAGTPNTATQQPII